MMNRFTDRQWELMENVGLTVFRSLGLLFAVVVGTALGNGIPLARSTTVAFREGLQAGLHNCPCRQQQHQEPTVAKALSVAAKAGVKQKPCSSCEQKRLAQQAALAAGGDAIKLEPSQLVPEPEPVEPAPISPTPLTEQTTDARPSVDTPTASGKGG